MHMLPISIQQVMVHPCMHALPYPSLPCILHVYIGVIYGIEQSTATPSTSYQEERVLHCLQQEPASAYHGLHQQYSYLIHHTMPCQYIVHPCIVHDGVYITTLSSCMYAYRESTSKQIHRLRLPPTCCQQVLVIRSRHSEYRLHQPAAACTGAWCYCCQLLPSSVLLCIQREDVCSSIERREKDACTLYAYTTTLTPHHALLVDTYCCQHDVTYYHPLVESQQ